jgi:hypothetical protein
MVTRVKTLSHFSFFRCQIYLIFLAVLIYCLPANLLLAQEINSFKTINSGNYDNPAIWRVFDGASWVATLVKPSLSNDIYIDRTQLVTLTGNEQAKSVFINAETGATQKLNLSGFALEIYGSLNAFAGAAPGTASGTWNSLNWIGNTAESRLIFRGTTRTIIRKNHWSGFTTNSRYSVIIDPGIGQELTIEEPFKAVQFTISSGALIQKLDSSVFPAVCASISFNTETTFYDTGSFGTLIIGSGAKFISQCNAGILFRSATVSAGLFDLQSGGQLILEGQNPRIEAAIYELNGTMIFRGGTIPKTFLSSSFSDAATPNRVTNLELQGNQNLSLPGTFFVQGDLIQSGQGAILTTPTDLHFVGGLNQNISGFALTSRNLTVNKSGGKVNLNQNLAVTQTLSMTSGILNFNDNNLSINSSSIGGLFYTSGSWERLREVQYFSMPSIVNASNATFPFADRYQKGIRSVKLLGNTGREDLRIRFTEYLGAEYNSNFNDNDGTPILYRLFSYFSFFGMTANSNPLELRISAANLIVDQVDDLRIVATGYAAPGTHLPGLDPSLLWARRSLTFSQLEGTNYTVGSFRTLSILPVTWLTFYGQRKSKEIQLTWKVASDIAESTYEVFRSENGFTDWKNIGSLTNQKNSETSVSYQFSDLDSDPFQNYYYRIKQTDFLPGSSWSQVILVKALLSMGSSIQISPNPYFGGSIRIKIPPALDLAQSELMILDFSGKLYFKGSFNKLTLEQQLLSLPAGIYLIRIGYSESAAHIRWIKR